ncbi:hypothetical protein BDP81DRAFT_90731 [Colletotrichum phormii]|uniref:Uncharacterized protein n=1 Tax=Colletotrichum phormii TaxID=359342 RepID=A0AAJ0A5E3_9PEZI|nr:uncharacterized protein BDP81DRAFT_90731 [Colletotrichum phormii]KAK1654910.1 hypothetical protein BDP81DRAFT_90731 [Colletotrichum phormii]
MRRLRYFTTRNLHKPNIRRRFLYFRCHPRSCRQLGAFKWSTSRVCTQCRTAPIALRHRIANALVPESPIMGPTHPVRNADSCSPGPLAFLIGRGRNGNESHRPISDLNGCFPWPTCPSTDWFLQLVKRDHVRWHHDAELLQCCTSRSVSPRLAVSVGMRLIELRTDILGYDALVPP